MERLKDAHSQKQFIRKRLLNTIQLHDHCSKAAPCLIEKRKGCIQDRMSGKAENYETTCWTRVCQINLGLAQFGVSRLFSRAFRSYTRNASRWRYWNRSNSFRGLDEYRRVRLSNLLSWHLADFELQRYEQWAASPHHLSDASPPNLQTWPPYAWGR